MTRIKISQVMLGMALALVLSSCGTSESKNEANTQESPAPPVSSVEEPKTESKAAFADFDWSTVPPSTANIGGFPYLTAPTGFFIQDRGGSSESKTGYSELKDFNKLIMYTGNAFYNAEGKVAELKFSMKDKEADWNQYGFDKNIDDYLTSIGAKLLGKHKITSETKEFLNKDDDMAIYNHMVGDPYNEPVRFYALNTAEHKVMFQVFSNSASGEVGVVELAAFKPSIKAPDAVQMKKDIDDKGKAVLNINFDTDKATLQPDGQKAADEILSLLSDNSSLNISIEGHTDNTGTPQRNKQLSVERANTLVQFLTSKGISGQRLTATGYGAEKPLVANDSEENMAKNRRVELVKK